MSLTLIIGPMFSGKSTELLRRIRRYEIAEKRCLLFKYLDDVRYSIDEVVSHDGLGIKAIPTLKLLSKSPEVEGAEVVGIDEGQFFSDLGPFVEFLLSKGIHVIVAGLDATAQKEPFGDMVRLVPEAEEVIKLKAICMLCKGDASFTKKKHQNGTTVEIGGSDLYLATCRRCFMI